MIILIEDRRGYSADRMGRQGNTIFLKAGSYDKLRMIPGLGWLVDVGYFKKNLQTSVIRFSDGEEVE